MINIEILNNLSDVLKTYRAEFLESIGLTRHMVKKDMFHTYIYIINTKKYEVRVYPEDLIRYVGDGIWEVVYEHLTRR